MQQSDRLVTFVFSHQTLIIEGIFATILGVIVIWLFASLQDENQQASSNDSQEIKRMLKKALEVGANSSLPTAPTNNSSLANPAKPGAVATPPPVATFTPPPIITLTPQAPAPAKAATTIIEAAPAPAPTSASVGSSAQIISPAPIVTSTSVADAAEAMKLKSDIENRNKKVDELEAALRQAREEMSKMQDNSRNTDSLDALRKQIATLEGRLKEYAIIEDDIANLAAYKDENEKLKTEIALLKKKGIKPDAEDLVVPHPSSNMKTKTAEITAAPLNTPAPAVEEQSPSWPINEGESKKLLNEFDTLMNTQSQSATNEIIDQSNASDGEKLIAEFQDFMKGIN